MQKYFTHIYNDVKEWFKENDGREVSNEEIDKMPRECVLDYYLQWNGIIGYTHDIGNIMGK